MSTQRKNSQFRYWLVTAPQEFVPEIFSDKIKYIRGQKEVGKQTGFIHWQLIVYFKEKITLTAFKKILIDKYGDQIGNAFHLEPSKSDACEAYVWKEDTRVENTQFELGMYVR